MIEQAGTPTLSLEAYQRTLADVDKDHLDALERGLRLSARTTAQQVIEMGKYLAEARAILQYGYFEKWVERLGLFSVRSARYYMAAYERFKSATIADLTPSVLYYLSSPSISDAVAQQVIDLLQASSSKTLTLAEAKTVVDYLQAGNQATQIALDSLALLTPGTTITVSDVRSVSNVLTQMLRTGAIDPGTGEDLPLSEAVKHGVTEETYERGKRQETHIREARQQAADRALLTEAQPLIHIPKEDVELIYDALSTSLDPGIWQQLQHLIAKRTTGLPVIMVTIREPMLPNPDWPPRWTLEELEKMVE